MSLHTRTNTDTPHDLDYCHDEMHVDGDSCPACGGYRTGCPDPAAHETPSAQASATTPPSRGVEGRRPGREVEPPPPTAPSHPAAHDRITWALPLAAEQETHDTDWTVTLGLTEDAARQLARDLTRRHMADLVLLARLTAQGGRSRTGRADAEEVETRLAGALQSMATTRWTLTPGQTETLLDDLEAANTEPATCAVGTCSAYAIDGGSYCAPHDERA